jgi:hypothetical protein
MGSRPQAVLPQPLETVTKNICVVLLPRCEWVGYHPHQHGREKSHIVFIHPTFSLSISPCGGPIPSECPCSERDMIAHYTTYRFHTDDENHSDGGYTHSQVLSANGFCAHPPYISPGTNHHDMHDMVGDRAKSLISPYVCTIVGDKTP